MRKLALLNAIVALSPLAVSAQGLSPSISTSGWTGYYGGASISEFKGDVTTNIGPVSFPADKIQTKVDGNIFAGYNWHTTALSGGVEVEYTYGGMAIVGSPGSTFDNMVDIKGRLGVANDQMMLVGILGISYLTFEDPGDRFYQAGINYGVGVDFKITDQMFVGVEYLERDLIGTADIHSNEDIETKSKSVSARIGWKF